MRRLLWSAALLAALVSCADAEDPPKADKHPGIGFGLYQISPRVTPERLAAEKQALGYDPAFVMFYIDLEYRYPRFRRRFEAIKGAGSLVMLSWELWKWHRRDPKEDVLTAITMGRYDDVFTGWADGLKAWREPVFIRLGFEMNGNWFAWGGRNPKGFVKAWKHVVKTFRDRGVTNVVWVWSPNILSVPKEPWNAIRHYYPGDEWCDWVALDGYNWGQSRPDGGAVWASMQQIFEKQLDDFDRRYPTKPQMLGETGCAEDDGGSKAQWIRDGLTWLGTRPRVRAVCWFNFDKRREKEENWRLDSDPRSLAAARDLLSKPPFTRPFSSRP